MKCSSREVAEYVYEVNADGEVIIYSPILRMATTIATSHNDKSIEAIISKFSSKSLSQVAEGMSHLLKPAESPSDMDRMTILPNFKCNLNCTYCYAAKGRSEIEMDVATLDAALDWFLDKTRLPGQDLYIHIVGGGEPILSWGIIEETVRKASIASRSRGRSVDIAITTNGTLITEDIAKFLAKTNVLVNVSFEVIEEVQNRHRGMYEKVEHGILALQKAGARLAIRATISPWNVDRMSDMVDIVNQKFPRVSRLNLEAVMAGKEIFASASSLRNFLEKFRVGFDVARRKASSKGLSVVSAAQLKFGSLKERFCQGDFCLTPSGDIVICHRVSSPKERNFEHYVFGAVKGGRLLIDKVAYRNALAFTLDDDTKCRQCFLRLHCGGLCVAKQTSFPMDYYDVLCDSAREEGVAYLRSIAMKCCNDLGVPTHKNH